jgi:aminoglycoside 3-N-acetyltransferase I
MQSPPSVCVLGASDIKTLRNMLSMFGSAFDDAATYCASQPDDTYLQQLLRNTNFVAIAAISGTEVIGGLAGYVLPKFEQKRSEFYIYDLAVDEAHRRQGIATALIEELKRQAVLSGI